MSVFNHLWAHMATMTDLYLIDAFRPRISSMCFRISAGVVEPQLLSSMLNVLVRNTHYSTETPQISSRSTFKAHLCNQSWPILQPIILFASCSSICGSSTVSVWYPSVHCSSVHSCTNAIIVYSKHGNIVLSCSIRFYRVSSLLWPLLSPFWALAGILGHCFRICWDLPSCPNNVEASPTSPT